MNNLLSLHGGASDLLHSSDVLRRADAGRFAECLRQAEQMTRGKAVEFPGCEAARNEYLEQRWTFFNPASFNLPTNTVLGTTQRWAIDRTWKPHMKNEKRQELYSLWKRAVNKSFDWVI